MNKRPPSTEALDEQERELARILRALPSGEPPAALDARILKAASNAAAGSRRPHARWLASAGALWGVGGAAAAVLAFGLTWKMMYPAQKSPPSDSPPAARMVDKNEDSGVWVGFKDEQADQAARTSAPASAPPPRQQNAPSTAISAPQASPSNAVARESAPAEVRQEAFAADAPDERAATSAEVGASAAAPPTSSTLVGGAESTSISVPSKTSADQARLSESAKATAETSSLKPSAWLAEIRMLRDENRTDEARESLLRFQKHYPNLVIPSDLAPLLRE